MAPANTAAISGQTISSTAFNTLETDIGTEITNSVDRGGRSAMTAALPMGSQKITGMADPTVATDGATKNYVDTTTATFFSTGDVKLTFKTVADSGWTLFADQTIGSGSSGANETGAQLQALFTLLFNNVSDTAAPIFTSGGGATTRAGQTNAASAWAANCRMSLTKTLGRALAIAGTGSGLTARPLGSTVGAETLTLAANQIPSITSVNATQSISVAAGGIPQTAGTITPVSSGTGSAISPTTTVTWGSATTLSGTNSISTTYTNASPTAVSLMQPTTFLNAMVKQ